MRNRQLNWATGVLMTAGMLLAVNTNAALVTLTLGDQDFADGSHPVGVSGFNGPSAGEPAPFDMFRGNDIGPPSFSESWTFTYAPGVVNAATITIGIFDHDSFLPGNQVASFSVDGNDLTAQLNALFESHGGTQNEDNVYSFALSSLVFPALSDGSATFSLTLQGGTGQPSNGAGLDFSTLQLNTGAVPEPATLALLGMGLAGLGFSRRKQ